MRLNDPLPSLQRALGAEGDDVKDVLDSLLPFHMRYDGDVVTTGMAVALINFCTGLASVWCWIRVVRMALA